MAVQLDTVTVAKFEDLFERPSIQRFLDELSDSEFEDFVGYVFTCAGYRVENVASQHFPHGPGVDLQIYRNMGEGGLSGRVEVKHYKDQVSYNMVREFVGVLDRPPIVPGYMVTTGAFSSNAYNFVAEARKQVYLIDGDHLIRYITYIRGSRAQSRAGNTGGLSMRRLDPKHLFEGDEITEAATRQPSARILTVANNKGGVAKTTTALNLGFALATQQNQRVLVVDMDSQSSLTHSLPRKDEPNTVLHDEGLTLADAIGAGVDFTRIVRDTRFPGLSIAPSSPELLRYDTGSGGQPEVELNYVRRLQELAAQTNQDGTLRYQWIVIDTPPAQSSFTRMALAAADLVLVPMFVETYAELGINAVVETLQTMQALLRPSDRWKKALVGSVITRWRSTRTTESAKADLADILASAGVPILGTSVPADDKVEQAISETAQGRLRMIFQLGRTTTPAAQAYAKLAKEIVDYGN